MSDRAKKTRLELKLLGGTALIAAMIFAACGDKKSTTKDDATPDSTSSIEAPPPKNASFEALEGFDSVEAEAEKVEAARAKGQTALETPHDAANDGAIVDEILLAADAEAKLGTVLLDERRKDDLARGKYRHPAETLAFFGIEPDMTVVEALPGGGWYTRILLPYLHPEGSYMAINYPISLFETLLADVGIPMSEERRASIAGFETMFPQTAEKFGPEGAKIEAAMTFGNIKAEYHGKADAVLYIRALHNLARYDQLDVAVSDSFNLLKSGGVVGIVQHRAKADAPDAYTTGQAGYLKQADVISAFEKGGFIFEQAAEFNANTKDSADYAKGVWTLPPTLNEGEKDREKYIAIGRSDRMTLRFRKP